MKNFVLTILVLFTTTFMLSAQNRPSGQATIKGVVKDKLTGLPVEYSTIVVYNVADSSIIGGIITDTNGIFAVEKIPFGNYYLVANYMGYKSVSIMDISLSESNKLFLVADILLEEDVKKLEAVILTSKSQGISVKIDKKVLNVDKNISAAGGTAIDALKASPSVSVDTEGNILLRGSSSFKVLVNGRPSAMNSNDALKQIPAGKIDKIEIITNPSAKYNAEGTAGIINIITKKGMGAGLTGLVNSTAGTGKKYNADATINYMSKKLTMSAGLKWKDNTQYYTMPEYFESVKNNEVHQVNAFFRRTQIDRDLGANISMDYSFDPKNTLSYSADGGSTKFYVNAFFKYDENKLNQPVHTYTYEDLHTGILAKYITNNLSYTKKFGKQQEWTNSLFHSHINYSWFTNQDRTNTGSDFDYKSLAPYYTMMMNNENFSNEFKFQSDYSKVFEKEGKLEVGGQIHKYRRSLNLIAQNYNYGNMFWEPNKVFTNKLDFTEKVYSGYVNYTDSYKGFDYSLGLRTEYTDRKTESFTLNKQYNYNKLNFFPTLSISKSIGETSQFSLNYSRRIQRPDEFYLNPFPDISNNFQQAYGNPLLKPNITGSVELGYLKKLKKGNFSSQAYMRSTRRSFDQVISPDRNGIMTFTFENVADTRTIGIENMLTLDLTNWWNMNSSLNLFNDNIAGVFEGQDLKNNIYTFNTRLTNTFKICENTSVQLTTFYYHNQISTLATIKPLFWMEASVKQTFLKKRLSLTLQMKDLFNSNKMQFNIDRETYKFRIHQKPEYPVIIMTLSYKFKNHKSRSNKAKTNIKLG